MPLSFQPNVPFTQVHIGGLGTLHDDPNWPPANPWMDPPQRGSLFCVTPAGAGPVDCTPSVMLHQFYTWQLYDTPHQFVHQTLHPALTDTNRDRTMVGVGEEVNIGFKPPVAANVLQWFCWEGGLQTNVSWDGAGGVKWTAPSNEISTIAAVTGARCAALFVCALHGARAEGG